MKRIAITLALSLLPITVVQPVMATKAEAGVFTCKKRQTFYPTAKRSTYNQRTYAKSCTYSSKGSSR